MHRKTLVLATLVLISASNLWSLDWRFAPAAASSGPSDISLSDFRPVEPGDKPAEYLPEGEGWIWLRAEIPYPAETETLIFTAPQLAWTAWWDQLSIGESGKPPIFWAPSSEHPIRVETNRRNASGVLLVKMFVRRGYSELPSASWSGDSRIWADVPYLLAVSGHGLPYAGVILGFLVFIGGLISSKSKVPWKSCLSFFGLFSIISFMETPLALVPDIARLFSWSVIGAVSRASIPFMLSFWRRSVGNTSRRDPVFVSILDYLLATVVSIWLVLPFIPADFLLGISINGSNRLITRVSAYALSNSPLLPYAVWSGILALFLWIGRTITRRPGRFGSLMIFLFGISAPVLYLILTDIDVNGIAEAFAGAGMVLALLASLPPAYSPKAGLISAPSEKKSGKKRRTDQLFEDDDEDAEEVEELDEIEPMESIGSLDVLEEVSAEPGETGPAIGFHHNADPESIPSTGGSSELILRSLRSTMYPESLPWDSDWALASARQGSRHPATGFHDVYTDTDGRLSGFSFFDAGSDSLEAMYFAHMVRSELARSFPEGLPLPKIARTVHRRSVNAAGASGRILKGVLGRFTGNGISFLQLELPPMLLRRGDGSLILLPPQSRQAGNPAIGSRGFGNEGLRTMNVDISPDDVLVIFTPSIIGALSSSGQKWSMAGLASALKESVSEKPEGIVADIIAGLKDFCGSDELEDPLQLLVLKRR